MTDFVYFVCFVVNEGSKLRHQLDELVPVDADG